MNSDFRPRDEDGPLPADVVVQAPGVQDSPPVFGRVTGSAYQSIRGVRRNPVLAFALVVILSVTVAAVAGPWLTPYDPEATGSFTEFLSPPSWAHPFGTDRVGRDVLTRVIYGARPAMVVGLSAVAIGVCLGTALGMVSGFFRGWVEAIIQRSIDVVMSIPTLILLLIAVALFSPSLPLVSIAIGATLVPSIGRITHGVTIQATAADFVESARVVGASDWRILRVHLLPNIMPSVIVISSAVLPAAILLEGSLSFLGLGVPPPAASWGADLSGPNRNAFVAAPWLVVFPGAALSLTILAFNLLGDSLRDLLDPRLRGSR